jgi:Domain of unknown function (DUF1772)
MIAAKIIMLLSGGVFTGGAVAIAVDRLSAWAAMSTAEMTVDFGRSAARMDPMQPIFAVISIVAAVVCGILTHNAPRAWAFAGAVGLAIVVVTSIFVGEPINMRFRNTLRGGELPDARQLCDRWSRFHRVRTVACIVSFGLLATAAVVS